MHHTSALCKKYNQYLYFSTNPYRHWQGKAHQYRLSLYQKIPICISLHRFNAGYLSMKKYWKTVFLGSEQESQSLHTDAPRISQCAGQEINNEASSKDLMNAGAYSSTT